MAVLLYGRPVADSLISELTERVSGLKADGVVPCLAIIRCGEKKDDISYERGAEKCAAAVGVEIRKFTLPETVSREELLDLIDEVNADAAIHGCLMLRPLPAHLREYQQEICSRLAPQKDVDGMTELSNAGLYMGRQLGFPPCTAEACMKLLDFYGIDCKGKNAVVIGRSQVIGKPAAMLLLQRDASVTVCHSKSLDTERLVRNADIVISSAGKLNSLTGAHVRPGQTIIDVSINWDETKPNSKGGLGAVSGDAVFHEVEPIVEAITPVPGGVGAVTSSVLMSHVVQAAEGSKNK